MRSGPGCGQELGIPLISQVINFGEESFREGVDMDHAAFMARLQTGRELPKTAAPYPGDFIQAFMRSRRTARASCASILRPMSAAPCGRP